jgi:hypothetical protein
MEFTPVNGYDYYYYHHQYSSAVVTSANSMHIWRTASSAVELPVRYRSRGLVALDSDGTSDCRPQSHRAQTGLCRTGFSETGVESRLAEPIAGNGRRNRWSIEQRQRLLRQEPFFGSNNVDFGDTDVDNSGGSTSTAIVASNEQRC